MPKSQRHSRSPPADFLPQPISDATVLPPGGQHDTDDKHQTSSGCSAVECKHQQQSADHGTLPPPQDLTKVGLLNAQSVGNKYATICDRISSDRLHLRAVVETWHDSADDPNLIACAPPGYLLIERARPRDDTAAQNTKTNHGAVCLFYTSSIGARQVP